MKKLILITIVIFYGLNVFSQEYIAIFLPKNVYQNKQAIEHGLRLKPSQKITTTDSSFCIVMHTSGRFIELNKKGEFTYEELLTTINQQKLTLTDKFRVIFQQMFLDNKNMVVSTGSVVRCPTSRVGAKSKNYYSGIPLHLYWREYDSKSSCSARIATFYNLFNEEVFSDTVKNKINRYALSTPNLESSDALIFRVCHTNGCSEDLYGITVNSDILLQNEYEQFVEDIKAYSPITKIYLRYAFFSSKKMYSYLAHEILSLYPFRNHPGVNEFYGYGIRKGLQMRVFEIETYNIVENKKK